MHETPFIHRARPLHAWRAAHPWGSRSGTAVLCLAPAVTMARAGLARFLAGLAAVLALAITTLAQVPTVSPAAQAAHAGIAAYEGPKTCVACHQQQALEMFGSVHYQEMGETPAVPNIDGPAGKGLNGARVMNSYCGTPTTSSRATCATCHVGNGRLPSPELTQQQLENIDCMLCHQDAYKRLPDGPYQTISFPGTNGLHTISAPIEDATGFDYVPDQAKMTITVLEAARTVHLPTRASCLRCHAGAGGSDGGKRGDISTVTVNPPLTSDVHMSPQGANLSCANCHSVGGHRVAGRGVDLRPTDAPQLLACANCHTDRPHGDFSSTTSSSRDLHAGRVACQTCHIPTFAKDKSTEMERSWLGADFSMAACRGQGGWLPHEVRASNVIPTYRWFDGTSLANSLDQVPVVNDAGEYLLALPNGSVQSAGAKLYPMKLHRSDAAVQDSTGLLIPHSTFSFFTSGDFAKAVADGQELSGLGGAASVVPVQEYQTINHGVEASANALQCGACHSAYATGGPARLNLQADLGYALKGPQAQVCSQCHGNKSSPGFASVHNKHVTSKRYDCSNCHNFSRPERGLTRVSNIRPAAPGGPVAKPISESRVDLVWADNSSSEQGFKVERSADGASFVQLGTVSANVTTVADTTVAAGHAYYYRVRAFNAVGDSDYSLLGRVTPGAASAPTPPAAPAGLAAATVSSSQINLVWKDASDNEDGFVLEISTDNVNFSALASVNAGVTSHASTGLNAATTYYYRVRAFNAAGSSAYSGTAGATTSPPPAPVLTGLTVSPATASVMIGQTRQFAAVAVYSDGTQQTVTTSASWRSANTAVATVTPGGLATGVSAGTATVTASYSGFNATASLSVSSGTRTFSNTASLSIPDRGPAGTYPSTIRVSGMSGTIARVTVTLVRLSHTNPDDLDILLVGPRGQKVMLMSDAGGSEDVSGIRLTFDDAGAVSAPDKSRLTSAVYRPGNYGSGDTFSAPAPAGPYANTLSVLNGSDPNGSWTLYVVDDQAGNRGSISGGWSLSISTTAVP